MKILDKSDKHTTYFILTETEKVSVTKLSRKNLVTILQNIYNDNDYYNDLDTCETRDIKNPVEKAIVEQIILKLCDFKDSAKTIQSEINASFPPFE